MSNLSKKATEQITHANKGAYSNTPPLNTQVSENAFKNRVLIDWLEFTVNTEFMYNDRYKSLKSYLGYQGVDFVSLPRGMNGYPRQMSLGRARILYGATVDMGVHVVLSGEAIRDMTTDLFQFIHFVLHMGGRFTRVDVACDDFTQTVTPQKCLELLEKGHATSKFKTFRDMKGGTIKDGLEIGRTIYLGSPSSRLMVRIYDKALEQISKQNQNGDFCGPVHPWTRVELQIRKENAHSFIEKLHENQFSLGSLAMKLLNNYIQFRTVSTDTNKSRWGLVSWWASFLNTTEKLSISIQKAVPTLERMNNWFKKQIAPTFATLLNAYGPDHMKELYTLGRSRMTQAQRDMALVPF